MITELKDNQIFVFGSNLKGEHLGGAAKQAYENFGAEWGVGEGLTGKSYAFPTLDKEMNKLSEGALMVAISNLKKCCEENSDKEFLLTKVGCGIAGFEEDYIKNLFKQQPIAINLVMPEDWELSN